MISAVLFDLDGTLLDTALDIAYALNLMRRELALPPLSFSQIKPWISFGSKMMLEHGLGLPIDHADFKAAQLQFFNLYEKHLDRQTQFFPGAAKTLDYLDEHQIPWGIVTNKLSRHTFPLLKALNIDQRAHCVIAGDTLDTQKPHPGPLLSACDSLQQPPVTCLYLGDAESDVIASQAAGARSCVALYGYVPNLKIALSWQATHYIQQAIDLIPLLDLH